jgi:hypothetical protein
MCSYRSNLRSVVAHSLLLTTTVVAQSIMDAESDGTKILNMDLSPSG